LIGKTEEDSSKVQVSHPSTKKTKNCKLTEKEESYQLFKTQNRAVHIPDNIVLKHKSFQHIFLLYIYPNYC